MSLIVFSEKMRNGVAEMDAQHHTLIEIINQLYKIALGRTERDALYQVFEELAAYLAEHLAYEEKLFADTNYPGSAAHKASHDILRKKVADFGACNKSGKEMILALELLHFLKQWLASHIMTEDKKACAYLNELGIY